MVCGLSSEAPLEQAETTNAKAITAPTVVRMLLIVSFLVGSDEAEVPCAGITRVRFGRSEPLETPSQPGATELPSLRVYPNLFAKICAGPIPA